MDISIYRPIFIQRKIYKDICGSNIYSLQDVGGVVLRVYWARSMFCFSVFTNTQDSSSGSIWRSVSGWWVHFRIKFLSYVLWHFGIDTGTVRRLVVMAGHFIFCLPCFWTLPIMLAIMEWVIYFAKCWNYDIWMIITKK